MKKKRNIIVVMMIGMLLLTMILTNVASAGEGQHPPHIENNTIKVAAHNSNKTLPWGSGYQYFFEQLDDYSWIVDNQRYIFSVTETKMHDVYNGNLTNFHVLVVDGVVDEQYATANPLISNFTYGYNGNVIRDKLKEFIEDGGGYVGHCGGAYHPIKKDGEHQTAVERDWDLNAFFLDEESSEFWFKRDSDCDVTHITSSGYPILSEFIYKTRLGIRGYKSVFPFLINKRDPTRIGASSYVWYPGYDMENPAVWMSGDCINAEVRDPDHPILKDYLNDTTYMRWAGGPAFKISDTSNIDVLLNYPDSCIEEDSDSQIKAWSLKFVNNPLKARINNFLYFGSLIFGDLEAILKFEDYEPTTETIRTKNPGKPAMVAFNYQHGDESGGRVLLTGLHPQSKVFFNSKIVSSSDTSTNSYYNGFCYRVNKTTEEPLDMSDLVYNYTRWFTRREIAWASNQVLEDDYLPPVYGRSQVVDIDPLLQESDEFIIKCCVGKEKNEDWDSENLSLYYMYNGSDSNYEWTNWIYYDSIDSPWYRFTFNASNANGTGRYRFCSIFNTTTGETYTSEEFPPGPDAECVVGGPIYADFHYNPKNPTDLDTITFTDDSLNAEGYDIEYYWWDFGDGNTSTQQNSSHQYADDGTYMVRHNVSNNLTANYTIVKTIVVRNIDPVANFTISPNIPVLINETINFTDMSTDSDGTTVNWTWDFNDEYISYEKNPSHQYNKSGAYEFSLTVKDNDNATDTKKGWIWIVNGYVNGNLSDDPQNHSWNSIQKGIDNLTELEFLFVKNGVYSENVVVNRSLYIMGENQYNTVINGSVEMVNPFDYELPGCDEINMDFNMSGNSLLMAFNNDSDVEENYFVSDFVYDYSGQENHGANFGAIWTTSTIKGDGAFDFDGVNDSINLSSIPALNTSNVTISSWIDWKGGSGLADPIVSQVDGNIGYCLYVNSTDEKPVFRIDGKEVKSQAPLSNGWHHIAGTHNVNVLKIYVDGVLMDSNSTILMDDDRNKPAFIGFDNSSSYFNGTIDEVAVWNRSLSDKEISTIYYGNYGVFFEGFKIINAENFAITPCNNTDISNCILENNSDGILIDGGLTNVQFHSCNIFNCENGIVINNSKPDEYNCLFIVECNIFNVTNGILVNNSNNISIIRTLISGSDINLSFTNCSFDTIKVIGSTSPNNVAPDVPNLSGPTLGDPGISYTYSTCTNDSNDDQILYLFDWDDGNTTGWLSLFYSNETVNASYIWGNQGGYYVRVKAKDIFNNESEWSDPILFRTETLPPLINSVENTPALVGFGSNVAITVNATDDKSGNWSGVKTAKVNITYPDSSTGNYTMENTEDDTYEYIFSDTWQIGRYNYTIWALDNAYNSNSSSGYSFNVSHLFGYTKAGSLSQSVEDRVTGSVFTANEYGTADNITACIKTANFINPPGTPTYKCMIFRSNDSKLIGTTEEWTSGRADPTTYSWITFPFQNPPVLTKDTEYILTVWGNNSNARVKYDDFEDERGRHLNKTYNSTVWSYPILWVNESRLYSIYCSYTAADTTPPEITNASDAPDTVGFGFNVTINADVTDNESGVDVVKVNITYPDTSTGNFTMNNTINDTYEYNFSDTWLTGQYNYSIWATDNNSNGNTSSGHSFNVSAKATINVTTIKDTYGSGEYINLTDPPGEEDESNNNDDDDSDDPYAWILDSRGMFWNKWKRLNEYMLEQSMGPINYNRDDSWQSINTTIEMLPETHPAYALGYRVYNNKGLYSIFGKPNAQDDWPVAFVYKGESPTIHTLRSELVGIGYLDPSQDYRYEVLQTVQDSQGTINGSMATYPNVFTGASLIFKYRNIGMKEYLFLTNTTKTILQNNPPSDFGLSNQESYLVFATKLDYTGLLPEHDGTTYTGNFTVTDGQINLRTAEGVVEIAFPIGSAFEYNYDPAEGRVYKDMLFRFIQYQGEYYLLAGIKAMELNQMTFPVVFDPTTFGPASVEQSSDDAEEDTAHTWFSSTGQDIAIKSGYEGYFRWNNITIEGDALCTNIYMVCDMETGGMIGGRTLRTKVYLINETNTSTFTLPDKGSNRTKTDNWIWYNKTYYSLQVGYGTVTRFSGTNLKNAATEVLNATYNNWESGNSIAIAWIDNASQANCYERIGAYDHPGGEPFPLMDPEPARLYITYLPAGNMPPNAPTNPYPANNTYPAEGTPTLSVYVEDVNEDELICYWYHNATPVAIHSYFRPEANGSWTNLTRTHFDANYKCIDEETLNTTDYVDVPTGSMLYDLYNFTNHTTQTAGIISVTVWGYNGGGADAQPPIISSSRLIMKNTTVTYGNLIGHTGQSYRSQTWTTNPETDQPWTWDDIDNFEFGVGLEDDTYDAYCMQLYIDVYHYEEGKPFHLEGTTTGHDGAGETATWIMEAANEPYTDYWWYVDCSDGVYYNQSEIFHFKTGSWATGISTSPADGDYNVTSPVDLNVTFTTPTGLTADVSWYSYNTTGEGSVLLGTQYNLGNGTHTYQWNCGAGTRRWHAVVDIGNFTNTTSATAFYCDDTWSDDFWGNDFISTSTNGSADASYIVCWLDIDSSYLHSYYDDDPSAGLDGTGVWQDIPFNPEIAWFVLDLGESMNVTAVRGRSYGSYDPTAVDIYVNDSTTFSEGDKVATGISTWQDTASWVEYDSTDRMGRYLNVSVIYGESVLLLVWGQSSTAFKIFDAKVQYSEGNLTSVNISLPSEHYWDRFNAEFTGNATFSILNGTDDSVLLSGLTGDNDDISSLSPQVGENSTLKLFADLDGASFDSWSISWTAVETSVDMITPYNASSYPLTITASGPQDLDNVTLWYRYSSTNTSWTTYTGYQVQRGRNSFASGDTHMNVTINEVDMNHAFVLAYPYMRQEDNAPGGNAGDADYMSVAVWLENSTTVRFKRETSVDDVNVDWQVLECLDDEFTVQRGMKTFTGTVLTTITDTISSVTPANSMAWHTMNTTGITDDDARGMQFISNVTGATTISFTRTTGTSITGAFRWVVVEWDTNKIDSFQLGDTYIDPVSATHYGQDDDPVEQSLDTPVDTGDSILLFQQCAVDNGGLEGATTAGYINTSTMINFYKYDTNAASSWLHWYVIDFGEGCGSKYVGIHEDESSSWGGETYNIGGTVDTDRALTFVSGTSNGDGTAKPRHAVVSNLVSSTGLAVWHNYTGMAMEVSWQVLELPYTEITGWDIWINGGNPDTAYPWSWDFDFPNSSGYYEFFSRGAYQGYYEEYASVADARCLFIPINISDPYPSDGGVSVEISPTLNITVSHEEGKTMDITWYSNSSGSWLAFGSNNSISNGTYHQTFVNASVNGQWWYWKVNVSDGNLSVESSVYRFYTGFESKIVNTGDTNIKGYLLVQVQYNDSGTWVVDNDTINETTTRTINVGEQLGLDLIFNGNVTTDDLTHGDGMYRIYAAFRDPDGDILVCDDETALEAWWEFEVDTS